MPYSIRRVTDSGDMREFMDLPYRLYREDPYWVPPVRYFQKQLFSPKHPFHEHADVEFFIALDSRGRTAGRIVSIVNHAHNDYHHEKTGFFGFLEMDRDPELARKLLGTVEEDLAAKGMVRSRGPMNYSTNEECGLLVKGFQGSPLIMMPYNHPWYSELIEACGYGGIRDLLAYMMDSDTMDYSRITRVADLVRRRSRAAIRNMCVRRIHEEVPVIMDIYNECWEDNWGFVPMSRRELDLMADEMKMILKPSLAPIVEIDGLPVAFAVSLPDANQAFKKASGSLLKAIIALKVPLLKTRIDRSRVLLLGVRKAYRGRGLEALLIDRIIRSNREAGFPRGELSWILDDNTSMRRILERDLNADQYRTYRIYEKDIPTDNQPKR